MRHLSTYVALLIILLIIGSLYYGLGVIIIKYGKKFWELLITIGAILLMLFGFIYTPEDDDA